MILRSDVERKRLVGRPVDARLGPGGYTPGTTREVYRTLAERAGRALQAGHGVIVDAVYADARQRASLLDSARTNRVRFEGLWLDAPLDVRTVRIKARTGDASDATAAVAARQMERICTPASWAVLDATGDADGVYRAARRVLDDFASGAAEASEQEPKAVIGERNAEGERVRPVVGRTGGDVGTDVPYAAGRPKRSGPPPSGCSSGA